MKESFGIRILILSTLLLMTVFPVAKAQDAAEVQTPDDYILLTVILKHDQSKTLDEIQGQLTATGFWAKFPPDGIVVESWYVMMGLGQVVTLRVPPSRLREVNRAVEQTAWGAFRTEIYATYDIAEVARGFRAEALKAR